MLVIKQARLYAPEPEGVQDILVEGEKSLGSLLPSTNMMGSLKWKNCS